MITKIYYDFIQTQLGDEAGEDYMMAEVGKPFLSRNGNDDYNDKNVITITEHRPAGEGDKWFYDIELENHKIVRVFNINTVFYSNAT
jgi:hypothetical protein